jgi:hypothetical protein
MTIRPLLVCNATRGLAAGALEGLFADAAGCAALFGVAGVAAGATNARRQTRGAMLTFIRGFSFGNKNRDGW